MNVGLGDKAPWVQTPAVMLSKHGIYKYLPSPRLGFYKMEKTVLHHKVLVCVKGAESTAQSLGYGGPPQ